MRRFGLQSTFSYVSKLFGLKNTQMFVSVLAPRYDFLSTTTVKKGRVLIVVDPRARPEDVIRECVHAFFREKELEMGIPPTHLTNYDIEEITAFIVSMAILGKEPRICPAELRGRLGRLEVPTGGGPAELGARMGMQLARLVISSSYDCVFPQDLELVKKVWGTDPLEVYNKLAPEFALEIIELPPLLLKK